MIIPDIIKINFSREDIDSLSVDYLNLNVGACGIDSLSHFLLVPGKVEASEQHNLTGSMQQQTSMMSENLLHQGWNRSPN